MADSRGLVINAPHSHEHRRRNLFLLLGLPPIILCVATVARLLNAPQSMEATVVCIVWLLGASVFIDYRDGNDVNATESGNIAAIESHYGIERLARDGSGTGHIVGGGDGHPMPVSFLNSAGLVHGDIVVDGNRATLYVGSSVQRTEYIPSFGHAGR